jgi:hypothetical protein
VLLQGIDEIRKALALTNGGPRRFRLNRICLSDDLIWRLIESDMDGLLLQDCHFDSKGSSVFKHILESLSHKNPSKHCFKLDIQLNTRITQWILGDLCSNPEFDEHKCITSLFFVLSGSVPKQPSLNNVSSLVFLPKRSDLGSQLSSEYEGIIKSVMSRSFPGVKHLLLKDINSNGRIEELVPISRFKLDQIHIWNCRFRASDLIWSASFASWTLIKSMHPGKVSSFQFAIPFDGHTTQVVFTGSPSFVTPNSHGLGHGLILSLEQNLPNDISSDEISLLTLLLSKADHLNGRLSSQSKEVLKSLMNRRFPNLKCLLLIGMDFGDKIENSIAISLLNLDLIYLWNCHFKADDFIWSGLIVSMSLHRLPSGKKYRSFQFTIRTHGHTTRIVCHNGPSPLMPNSLDLVYGLILPLGQDLPEELSLDNISFITLLPSRADPSKSSSSQCKQNMKSLMSTRCPDLRNLLLKGVSIDEVEKEFGSIQQLKLTIYLL